MNRRKYENVALHNVQCRDFLHEKMQNRLNVPKNELYGTATIFSFDLKLSLNVPGVLYSYLFVTQQALY
jgi:hypothetical protein